MNFLSVVLGVLCLLGAIGLLVLFWMARVRSMELKRFSAWLALEPEEGPAVIAPAQPPAPMDIFPDALERKLRKAGWAPGTRHLAIAAVAWLLAAIVAAVAGGALAFFMTLATAPLLGWVVLEFRGQRRMRQMSDDMLGFLERVRQLLSVGNSLSVALARATENSPRIVKESLASTMRRISNGTGVAESLERCAAELDIYELHLLATAARTNLRFGGSMTQILRNIIENIRKRSSIERELRADTTQIRSSAWVLAALPLLVATLVTLTNKDYAHWFVATQTGHKMIAYAIISQAIGAWLMRLITRTRY